MLCISLTDRSCVAPNLSVFSVRVLQMQCCANRLSGLYTNVVRWDRAGAISRLSEVRLLRHRGSVLVRLDRALHAPTSAGARRPHGHGASLEQARLAPRGSRQVPLQAQADRRSPAQVHRQGRRRRRRR